MYELNGSFVVETDKGDGWEIEDGPVLRVTARTLRKEYKESGEYLRVRILPVGMGATVNEYVSDNNYS